MQTLLPSYYFSFHCDGSRCKHSCCVDWEIDIDSHTYEGYLCRQDDLGERIRASVCTDEGVRFRLGEDGRCPFLNEDNLCRIIIEAGERSLPEICREHPRFRNYYGDKLVELGLGFSCEAALSCALSGKQLSFVTVDGELDSLSDLPGVVQRPLDFAFSMFSGYTGDFLREKYRVISLLTNESVSPDERFSKLTKDYHINPSHRAYLDFFFRLESLESLDSAWGELICAARRVEPTKMMLNAESLRLLALFIFRHASAESLYSLRTVVILSYYLIQLAQHLYQGASARYSFCQIVRLLSSELEYSEENTDALLDFAEQSLLG